MVTTQLLSLSVHEALTFDGTEIVLHPDLFSDAPTNINGGSSSVVSAATRIRPPNTPQHPIHRHTSSEPAPPEAMAMISSALADADLKTTTVNNTDDNAKALSPIVLSRQPSHVAVGGRLEVGNMIEIRVWDPLPSNRRSSNTSPSGGSFRHRTSPPSVTAATKSHVDASQTTAATLEAAASSLQMSFNSANAASEESSTDSTAPTLQSPALSKPTSPIRKKEPEGSASVADGSTLAFAEKPKDDPTSVASKNSGKDDVPQTVLAPSPPRSGNVPPLFPRSRSNTNDAPSRPANVQSSKPPTVHRNRTSQSVPAAAEPGERTVIDRRRQAVPPISTALLGSQNKPKTLHTRDISDMTMDTAGDHPFHSSALTTLSAMPSMDSGDDGTALFDDQLSKVSTTHQLRMSFTMLVTEKTLTSIKSSARTQVSMLRKVADLYNLSSYDMVTITKIEKSEEAAVLSEVSADFVMVTIKEQFISRGDMHYFQKTLLGKWIYEGERLSQRNAGVSALAKDIRHANRLARSGIITSNTTITFRSRSARIIWLVQISSEMWDYASPYETERTSKDDEGSCEIYFDKFVAFMYRLFEKWKELEVTHSLTVVFFSRTFLTPKKAGEYCSEAHRRPNIDVYGRPYEDHYKTVIQNETPSDWDSLVLRIKREFIQYPLDVGWNLSTGDGGRRPSNAMQGNLLEAINVTLNLLHLHFMDRDLLRTGNSVVVVSPGCGVFEVDRGLAEITYQRMMDDGIGSDMLSLGLPPLHIAPFFLYNNGFFSVDKHGVDAGSTYYEVPHWMHLSFASYEKEETGLSTGTDPKLSQVDGTSNNTRSHPHNLNIAANGFMLPKRLVEPDLHSNSPQRLASPVKNPPGEEDTSNKKETYTRQRALISGREFEDILEACRPRDITNSMPSALMALLQMHQHALERRSDVKESKISTSAKLMRSVSMGSDVSSTGSNGMRSKKPQSLKESNLISEWGAIDAGATENGIGRLSSSRAQQICNELEKSLLPSENTDRSDSSDRSSPASSFVSVYSHIMGKPPERGSSLGSYHDFHPPGGLQIQRSPSLDFDPSEEKCDMAKASGEKDNAGHVSHSAAVPAANQGTNALSRTTEDRVEIEYEKQVRDLIAKRDSSFFSPPPQKANISIPESSFHSSPLIGLDVSPAVNRSMQRDTPNQTKGNLGAALLQYSNAGESAIGNQDSIKRIMSVGMIHSGTFLGTSPHGQYQGRLSPGMQLGSDPPEPNQFHRYRNQGAAGDGALRTYLAPDGTAIQRLDGIPQGRPTGNPGISYPLVGSAPSDNLLLHRSKPKQSNPGLKRSSTRTSNSSLRFGAGVSPPMESILTGRMNSPTGSPSSQKLPTRMNKHGSKAGTDAGRRAARNSRQLKSAFNPFREHDEEEVLSRKTHNRRRWSHVFPIGEIEFKRHAGPNWRSLCQPAILPLTIDVHPSPQELRDRSKFYFNHYSIALSAMDRSYYNSNEELVLEMCRQRLAQDYQLVPPAVINESTRRGEAERMAKLNSSSIRRARPTSNVQQRSPMQGYVPMQRHKSLLRNEQSEDDETIQHTLSMGHKIQELRYHPNSDSVEVIQYHGAYAMHDTRDVYEYRYFLFSESTKKFQKVAQKFHKYGGKYGWSKVDNIICGDSEHLSEEMRYRRLSFGLIPGKFPNEEAEKEYISKFKRLLDYLSRLRQSDEVSDELDIKIISGNDARPDRTVHPHRTQHMRRLVVHLRKGKDDRYEWMEIALDPTFDLKRAYRISVNWLVASASKVETQVQLLQRRCAQYGLKLISFPQLSIAANVFLNPFLAPPTIALRDPEKIKRIESVLTGDDFVEDGVYTTGRQFLDCVDGIDDFEFQPKRVLGKQFVHRSGALFIRLLRDLKGRVVIVALENTRFIGRDDELRKTAISTLRDVWKLFESLTA